MKTTVRAPAFGSSCFISMFSLSPVSAFVSLVSSFWSCEQSSHAARCPNLGFTRHIPRLKFDSGTTMTTDSLGTSHTLVSLPSCTLPVILSATYLLCIRRRRRRCATPIIHYHSGKPTSNTYHVIPAQSPKIRCWYHRRPKDIKASRTRKQANRRNVSPLPICALPNSSFPSCTKSS
jgi:hypothetical protein